MSSNAFVGLLNNAALLLALVVFYDALPLHQAPRRRPREILSGALIGGIGVIVMLTPWRFSEGIVFDTRSILLSLTGFFFGLIPTLIATILTVALRLVQGGAGAWTGIGVILSSAGLGLAWRYLARLRKRPPAWYEFIGFGLVVHLVMLLWMLTLPGAAALDVITEIALPLVAIYPPGTLLVGLLLLRQRRRWELEAELRQERDLWAHFSETSLDAILLTSPDGRIYSANPAACRMYGRTEEEILQAGRSGLSDESDPRLAPALEERARTGRFSGELWQMRKDGQKFVGEITTAIFHDAEGRTRTSMVVRDVTARKQVADELRASEERYREISELMSDYAYAFDVLPGGALKLAWITAGFERTTGFTSAQSEARGGYAALIYPPDTPIAQARAARLFAGQDDTSEFRIVDRGGQVRWLSDYGRPVWDPAQGRVTRIYGAARDITERRLAEAEVSRQAEELAALNAVSRAVSASLSLGRAASAALAEIMRTVRPDQAFLFLREGDRLILQEALTLDPAAGPASRPEHRVGSCVCGLAAQIKQPCFARDIFTDWRCTWDECKDAGLKSFAALPLLRGEEVFGVIGLASLAERDFGAQAAFLETLATQITVALVNASLYETVQAHAAQLETHVEARTRELRAAQEKLVRQEKLAALGQLAGGVGHELRNPLAVISNAIYFLKFVRPQTDPKVKDYLDIIEREVGSAEKIISDLLDFARIKSINRAAVAVSDLVADVLARFPVPEQVRVAVDLPAGLPAVNVDPQQVAQVLGNLVTNACQAMPAGGELTICGALAPGGAGPRTRPPDETGSAGPRARPPDETGSAGPCARPPYPCVALSVRDTGVGIPPENIPLLFEPLFTTKAKGIGLGLAVSSKLMEANGGWIEVASEVGAGSVFTLYLPTQ